MSAPKGYKLVLEDNFDGPSLDLSKWEYRGTGPVQCGFFAPSEVQIRDGKLVLTGRWREDGQFGPGWYAGMINLRQRFTRGYFETRCLVSEALPKDSLWSAFWLQARHPYGAELSKGGPGGAEIDIFEAFNIGGRTSIEQNIHCKGGEGSTSAPGETDHLRVGVFNPENLCTEFHTFGLEWTETDYIFYLDGEEYARTSYADGVSRVDEYVILSLELPGKEPADKSFKAEFFTDWVRVYQK